MTKKVVELDKDGGPTGRIIFYFDDHRDAKAATDKEPEVTANPSFEVFEVSKVGDAVRERLALHGASQKIGDSYASAGAEADPLAAAKLAVKETIAQLYAGTWRVNAGGGPRVNDLAVALARVTGQPLEGEDGTIADVATMSDEDKKVLRAKPKIKAALAQIAAEKAIERAKKAQEAAEAADKAEAEKAAA